MILLKDVIVVLGQLPRGVSPFIAPCKGITVKNDTVQ
jgi:hypothetical protein